MKSIPSSVAIVCALIAAFLSASCASKEEREHGKYLRSLANQTTGRSNICPVHHLAMAVKSVDMTYGLIMFTTPQPSAETRRQRFPYATQSVLAGCVVSDRFPERASVYHCPDCLRTQAAWYAAHPK